MRFRTVLVAAAVLLTSSIIVSWPYVRVAAFIVRATHVGGWLERGARVLTVPIEEASFSVPTRHGAVRARLYRPTDTLTRAALLVSGVHRAAIDEPRLIDLAREVAATGWAILTPELPDLTAYEITPRSTDMIEDAAIWLSQRVDRSPDSRIGLMGISFSGGLAIVAAGRPSIRDRIRFVLSVGGHGNLPRVLRYLCTGTEPEIDGERRMRSPHDYGLAIVAYAVADYVVPAEQVEPFRSAVRTFLNASGLAYADPPLAAVMFQEARALEQALPDPARTLMHDVNERNVTSLGGRLLPYIESVGNDSALSPDQSPAPRAPVYLLHGTEDNVIPAVETRLLTRWLDGKTEVRKLLSRQLIHAAITPSPALADYWELVAFWRDLVGE